MAPTAAVARVPLVLTARRDSNALAAPAGELLSGMDLLDESDWTEEELLERWGDDMNKTATCRNCD
eukprot:3561455-Rhodomonas_salina.1